MAGRAALVIVLMILGALVLPNSTGRVFTSEALAQVPIPTPTVPDILPSPTPTPTEPPPSDDPGGGGGGGGGGDDDGDVIGGGGDGGGKADKGDGGRRARGKRHSRRRGGARAIPGFYHVPGSYDTEALLDVAAQLRSLGWPTDRVLRKVFAPFIIGGRANWVDTWGAPRFGPGPIVRTHEGQDVFCEYGDPVLATESGTVDFGDAGLGGKVARLHRPDGSYWYFAHLSDWNTREFSPGDSVEAGDVLGYCGNTGNAITSPPHVHFGWYQKNGEAKNPMRALVRWLRTAEARAAGLAGRAEDKRLRQIVTLTAERRFGDAFSPDLAEITIATESLWSAGSSPAVGALSLAQSALQAALAESAFSTGSSFQSSGLGAGDTADGGRAAMDPSAQLAGFFENDDQASFGEHAD